MLLVLLRLDSSSPSTTGFVLVLPTISPSSWVSSFLQKTWFCSELVLLNWLKSVNDPNDEGSL